MKSYMLKKTFKGMKKGTHFYMIVESEFIGVKDFVLRTKDLSIRIAVNEKELNTYFRLISS